MKLKFFIGSVLLTAMTFVFTGASPAKNQAASSEKGFYYCYITGYFNGDKDSKAFVYSGIKGYKKKPQTSCEGWVRVAEKNKKYFTGICSSYTLVGPFEYDHQAVISRDKKINQFRDSGYKMSGWSAGPVEE